MRRGFIFGYITTIKEMNEFFNANNYTRKQRLDYVYGACRMCEEWIEMQNRWKLEAILSQ